MCQQCGGVCALCGEFSEYIIPNYELEAAIYTCGEHRQEAIDYATDYMQKLEAAPWN